MNTLKTNGRDYKMIDGFVMFTDTREVFTQNGRLVGSLPKGKFPSSGAEMLAVIEKVKPTVVTEKVAEVKEEPKKSGLSVATLKGK